MTDPDPAVPSWRREPYRILFPLGVVLAWAGVAHWLGFALGWSVEWRAVFHSIAQIQGFMTCFAVGFLFTAIPRRTGTAPPAGWQMAVAIIAPVGTTVCAWFEAFAASQALWIALVGTLASFALRRFRGRDATRRPPASFVWIPIALAMGVAGTVMIALYGAADLAFGWHQLGRGLLLQGVFLSLVAGVGGMALPLITRGESPPDADRSSRGEQLAHVLAALLLCASFVIESFSSIRWGLALRCAIVATVLLAGPKIHRRPRRQGLHRWFVWLSAWALPIGYLLATVFPSHSQAGQHVVFVAGFALMALAVGLHVTFAHGGRPELLSQRSILVIAIGASILIATLARGLVTVDAARLHWWLGGATGAFLLATIAWIAAVARTWRAVDSNHADGVS